MFDFKFVIRQKHSMLDCNFWRSKSIFSNVCLNALAVGDKLDWWDQQIRTELFNGMMRSHYVERF